MKQALPASYHPGENAVVNVTCGTGVPRSDQNGVSLVAVAGRNWRAKTWDSRAPTILLPPSLKLRRTRRGIIPATFLSRRCSAR